MRKNSAVQVRLGTALDPLGLRVGRSVVLEKVFGERQVMERPKTPFRPVKPERIDMPGDLHLLAAIPMLVIVACTIFLWMKGGK